MVMYRIKKNDPDDLRKIEEKQHDDAYWQEIPAEYRDDLDPLELAELNNQPEDMAEAGSWVKPVVTFVIGIAFLFWIVSDMFSFMPDISFLGDSAKLAEDASVAALRSAIVTIESTGGSGTGFNVREDGLIITNRHVVEDGGILSITFGDGSGKVYTTREWTEIAGVDLAVVDIKGSDLPCLALSEEKATGGETVIFIGNPLGFDWTISQGTIIDYHYLNDMTPVFYFEGPVRPGSSGSPLFNDQSQVIGVIF
ncbi:MAG: serine protease, partial [Clostridiales bacterium]